MLQIFCFERKSLQQGDQPPSGFPSQRDQDVRLGDRSGEGGGSPCKPKSLNFLLLVDKNIIYWQIPHIGEKGISNSFQTSFNKILPAACIQLHNYELFEKVRLKLSPLIQDSVQQDYLPESYVRYLPSYQKCQKIVAPFRCGLLPPSPETLWESLGMGENPTQQPKIYSFFAIKEVPFNRFKSFPIKSFISSPSNINFQVIILCNLHLQLQSFLVYHFLNLQLYIHTCHANLTKQCLLNVAFSMTKALND